MKVRFLFLIAIFSVIAVGAVTANAQDGVFSKVDFDALRSKGDSLLDKAPYRMKITSERYGEGDSRTPLQTMAQTAEFQPPDRKRAVFSFKTSAKVSQIEIVEIGKRRFKRSDNGSWSEENNESQNRFTIKGDIVDRKEVHTFKKLRNVRIARIKAFGYESNTTSENESRVEHIWIDKEGRFLKREEWTNQNGRLVSHVLSEYDYDSTINIEPPIK
jgi:hypothetical protein